MTQKSVLRLVFLPYNTCLPPSRPFLFFLEPPWGVPLLDLLLPFSALSLLFHLINMAPNCWLPRFDREPSTTVNTTLTPRPILTLSQFSLVYYDSIYTRPIFILIYLLLNNKRLKIFTMFNQYNNPWFYMFSHLYYNIANLICNKIRLQSTRPIRARVPVNSNILLLSLYTFCYQSLKHTFYYIEIYKKRRLFMNIYFRNKTCTFSQRCRNMNDVWNKYMFFFFI